MYVPPHFAETRPDEIAAIIAGAPLAAIVAQTPEGLIAHHIPLLAGPGGDLVGHIALANDLHRQLAPGAEVLALFRGPEGYVSPNDYPGKADHHRHVPTWNYEAVHVWGTIHFQHDRRAKLAAVGLLTQAQERARNGAQAWRMADAPADYMQDMLAGIVAFRIAIRRVLAKAKLSQNRTPADLAGAVAGARAAGLGALADRMARALPGPEDGA